MTVALYPQPQTLPSRPSLIQSMDDIFTLAETVANTDFVPRGLRGNQPAIIAAILYGREIGIEPMQSLNQIAVIDGKPTLSAQAQRMLIQSHGHEFWFEDESITHVTACGRRVGSKVTQRVTWTLDDAKRARIAGKPNWQAYPRAMLKARASAELARDLFADVIGGMAASEEFEDVVVVVDEEPAAEEQPKTTRRRRRTAAAAPPPTVPPPAPEPTPEPEPEPQPADRGDDPDAPHNRPVPPEPTPAEPDRPNRAQLNMLFALFAEKGLAERDDRLAFSSRALGRVLQSATELSALDASRLIEALQAEPTPPARPAPPPAQPTATEQEVLDALQQELGATDVTDAQHGPGDFPDGF